MNGRNYSSHSVHLLHVGKTKMKLSRGWITKARDSYSNSMQVLTCGQTMNLLSAKAQARYNMFPCNIFLWSLSLCTFVCVYKERYHEKVSSLIGAKKQHYIPESLFVHVVRTCFLTLTDVLAVVAISLSYSLWRK